MNKRTRFLAWVMALSMMLSCYGGTTVFAVDTDTDTTADSCEGHSDWTGLITSNIGSYMTYSGGHYYLTEGDYYLDDDLEMGVTIYIWPGDTVNLCLNGNDIIMQKDECTILNAKNSSTLNLFDCGTDVRYYGADGWIATPDGGWTDENAAEYVANGAVKIVGGAIYGATSFDKGGAGVFIQNYATFNMRGGNILGCSCVTGEIGGGVYNYEGTFNMYSGVIAYNSSPTYAGGIFIRTNSTMNMYGGEIAYNYAPTGGAGVYSGGTFTMYNNASIHDNYGSTLGSGVYNAGGGTLIMEDESSISGNISGDGGSAGVYMPSYNSILTMTDNASITGNITTGIAAGVGLISGVMTISGNAKVSGNHVVDSVTLEDYEKTDDVYDNQTNTIQIVSAIGAEVVDSNVYLYNGKTITFDGFEGNDVFVTAAAGLGLVATSVDNREDTGNLSSDVTSYYAVRETNNTEVYLVEAQTLTGNEDDTGYDEGTIDVSNLDLFDVLTDETQYTIMGGTGVGTMNDEDLTVSSIGTFIIEAYTPACNTNPPTWQTSTLTVTPKTVTFDEIATIGSEVNKRVELDDTEGTLDGVVNEDDVSIDFSVAYGLINDNNYVVGTEATYDVDVYGISITGDDAGNYVLATEGNDSTTTVTINIATPLISWPTAMDIVYGDTRENTDLIGGTVVIKYGGEYYDITDSGKFVWVETGTADDAGTHTYAVQFVVDSNYATDCDATTAEAIAELTPATIAELTHNVTQVVQAKEVTFTIGNSIVSSVDNLVTALGVTATYDDNDQEATLAPEGYELWYYDVDDGSWSTTAPTSETVNESGEYLLGAALTSDNYRHAGTQESTAKQIGAFVIGSSATAYTVTFVDDNDTPLHDSITAIPETIHISPTLSGGTYTAWETELGGVTTVYDFGSRFAQPAYPVEFTAVEAAPPGTISGTITGTDLKGNTGALLEGVVVTLMQGAEQVAVLATDSEGAYEFEVPQGRYNLVVTRDQVIRNEETVYVELDSATESVSVEIPDIRQNTIFNVASGMTAITVDGMKDLMSENEVRSVKVELNPSSDTATILAEVAKINLTTDNAKYYIDLSIQQRVGDATSYTEKDLEGTGTDAETLTFYIPLPGLYQGYGHYSVYFDDGINDVAILTSVTDFTVVDDLLTLTVQKSGVYGLVFWDTATDETPESVPSKTVIYSATDTIDTDDLFAHIESTGTRSYLITSEDGGQATIDSAGNVTVTKVGTFTVTVKVAATSDDDACYSTATLTVNPKTVTISGITCVDQEVTDISNNEVTLNTGGLLSGVETGDSVQIDFDNAIGTITDDDYAENETLTTTGINTFDVTVTGLALTGSDADNYEITTDPTSKVTINMSLVYIAWPAAHDIVYGETQSNIDLYGGKVVVYDGSTYTDITDDGTFQWVDTTGTDSGLSGATTSTAAVDAGTYTYDVKFVEDVTSDASYSSTLVNSTQMIKQVVQPAAVTFTIEGTTITAEDKNGNVLKETDDYILQYANADTLALQNNFPTPDGTYYVYAYFTTSNYRHAGTQESTGKQIGAFTIGITNPDTYGVRFTGYEGGADYDITGALPQSIHILPTLDDTQYTGWEYQDGTTYDFGDRFTQPAETVSFTAIEAPAKTAIISGTVTGTNLNGVTGTISRVGVALYQGSTLVDYTTTSADDATLGEYSFNVAPGMYNLVVTYDLDTTTELTYFVDTTTANYNETIVLPTVIQNTVLEVATGLPDMVVDGLTTLAETGTDGGTQNSEVLLEITSNTTDDADIVTEIVNTAAAAGIDENGIKQFFNVDLSSRTGDDATFTAVTETDTTLTFYIPLTSIYQGHDEYTVYRYHDADGDGTGEVQVLNTTENGDGEYIEVSGNNLIIHAKYFSLYGIAFANETGSTTTTGSSGGSSTTYYSPSTTVGDNGSLDSVSPSRASRGTDVTITPQPDEGYQVGTVTVTDSAGNSYTVTDNGDGTYTFTQPSAKVTIAVTFVVAEEVNVTESELPFTDVSVDDWFYEDVLYLYELGLMSGTTATTFEPYGGNSRAMVAQMMYNLEGQPDNIETDFFPDVVVGDWFADAVNWCASTGVVDGYLDGLYRPDTIISRQEFANVLYDHCLHLGYDVSALDDLSAFADSPSPWAITYMMWAVEGELIQGDTSGYLNSTDQLTRCEAATVFARFLRNIYQA